MPANTRSKLKGRIILVQEDRFRVVEEKGRGYLFTLSRKSGIGQEELQRYLKAGATVILEYEGEPNMASGIALTVEPA